MSVSRTRTDGPTRGNASACGKAILLGEHAVVHGSPAIAVPVVGLHIEVTLSDGEGWELGSGMGSAEPTLVLARDAMLEASGWTGPPPHVRIRATLPPACGLGSSAALSVALARAVAGIQGSGDAERIRFLADTAENVFHGNPSGVDVATVIAERPIRFRRNETPRAVDVGGRFDLWIVDTEVRSSTSEAVASVRDLRREEPDCFDGAFRRIAEAVDAGGTALSAGSVPELARAMDRAMSALRDLGVSHPSIEQVVDDALQRGAAAAKLSGAGRGGVVLVLGPSSSWSPGRTLGGCPVLTRVTLAPDG